MASPRPAARDMAQRGTAEAAAAGAAGPEDVVREGDGAAAGHTRAPPIRGRNIDCGARVAHWAFGYHDRLVNLRARAAPLFTAMADTEDNVDRKLFRNMEKLRQLRIEHRDLDEVITRLALDIHVDELQLKRLKKRKLSLKDQITRLESELIPDLNA